MQSVQITLKNTKMIEVVPGFELTRGLATNIIQYNDRVAYPGLPEGFRRESKSGVWWVSESNIRTVESDHLR